MENSEISKQILFKVLKKSKTVERAIQIMRMHMYVFFRLHRLKWLIKHAIV